MVLTDGNQPLLIQDEFSQHTLAINPTDEVQNVNGAGDALAGASYAAFLQGNSLRDSVKQFGLAQAALVVSGQNQAPIINIIDT